AESICEPTCRCTPSTVRCGQRALACQVASACEALIPNLLELCPVAMCLCPPATMPGFTRSATCNRDRKSTRLNSSHQIISYAVRLSLLSFPTRRSSDLCRIDLRAHVQVHAVHREMRPACPRLPGGERLRGTHPELARAVPGGNVFVPAGHDAGVHAQCNVQPRSEEHTSELQSPDHLVCRPPQPTLFPYTTLFRSLPNRSASPRAGARRPP